MTDTPPCPWAHDDHGFGTSRIRPLALMAMVMAAGMASPLPAAPVDTATVSWEEDMRVEDIGYRLALANAAWCPQTQPLTGMMLHEIAAYDRAARPAVEARFGLGYDLGVRGIVAGSAADRAGLRRDDVIVAVGGTNMATMDVPLIRGKASFQRTHALETWLTSRLQSAPQDITVNRQGSAIVLKLSAVPGCAGSYQVEPGNVFDAWSDGLNIAVSRAVLAGTARPDGLSRDPLEPDGLAFIMAHEMGHNWLDQVKDLHKTLPADNWIRAIMATPVGQEAQADLIAIAAMRRAGYDPHAASRALDRLAKAEAGRQSSRGRQLQRRKAILDQAIAAQRP